MKKIQNIFNKEKANERTISSLINSSNTLATKIAIDLNLKENWKNIHWDFTPELQAKWEERGFNAEECKEWINIGIKPNEFGLAYYLRKQEKSPGWCSLYENIEQLRKEYETNALRKNSVNILALPKKEIKEKKVMINAQEWLDNHYPIQQRPGIQGLDISSQNLTGSLNLHNFISLEQLVCWKNELTSLDTSDCWKLSIIDCSTNKLTKLNVSNNPELRELRCWGNKQLAKLDISRNPELTLLSCHDCNLTNLDLSNNQQLQKLRCENNQLVELKLSDLSQLTKLYCSNNFLTNLSFLNQLNPSKLELLKIENNNFRMTDLNAFTRFINLKELVIGSEEMEKIKRELYNRFSGSLKSLQNLVKLESLHISNTDIDGGLEYLPKSVKKVWCYAWERPESRVKNIVEQLNQNKSFYFADDNCGGNNCANYGLYRRKWQKLPHADFTPESQKIWEWLGFTFEEIKEWAEAGLKVDNDGYRLAFYLKNSRKISPQEAKNNWEQLKKEYDYFKGYSSWALAVKRKGANWHFDYESQNDEKLKKEYEIFLEEMKKGLKLNAEEVGELRSFKLNPRYSPSERSFQFSQEQELLISKLIPNSELRERYKKYGVCQECGQPNTGYGDSYTGFGWCQPCNAQHFQQEFLNWTSGNQEIDKLLQKSQLSANNRSQVLEWIPYDRFKNIEHLAKGGFGDVHKAEWIDRPISYWNIKNNDWERVKGKKFDSTGVMETASILQQWSPKENTYERFGKREGWLDRKIALKSLDNSQNITKEFLQEISHYTLFNGDQLSWIVKCFGISQDPVTKNYIIVMDCIEGGDMRKCIKNDSDYARKGELSFLKIWLRIRITQIESIASGLSEIHEKGLIHKDFHAGNVLGEESGNAGRAYYFYITDLGLSRPANETDQSKVYGVLPYVAPEVLRGESYTQAADIYSFGLVAYEIISGLPPYYELVEYDDYTLAEKLCEGVRPDLNNIKIPQLLKDLISQCWDANPLQRPTAGELEKILGDWYSEIKEGKDTEFSRQYKEVEKEYEEEYRKTLKVSRPWTIHASSLLVNLQIKGVEKKIEIIKEPLDSELADLVDNFIQAKKKSIKDEEDERMGNKVKELKSKLKEKGFSREKIGEIIRCCERLVELEQQLEKVELQTKIEIPTNK